MWLHFRSLENPKNFTPLHVCYIPHESRYYTLFLGTLKDFYIFLFLASICWLCLSVIPSMVSHAMVVSGLKQVTKFVEAQKQRKWTWKTYVLFFCIWTSVDCYFSTNPPPFKHQHPPAVLAYFFRPPPPCGHHNGWLLFM